jgi:hypothetical protein
MHEPTSLYSYNVDAPENTNQREPEEIDPATVPAPDNEAARPLPRANASLRRTVPAVGYSGDLTAPNAAPATTLRR